MPRRILYMRDDARFIHAGSLACSLFTIRYIRYFIFTPPEYLFYFWLALLMRYFLKYYLAWGPWNAMIFDLLYNIQWPLIPCRYFWSMMTRQRHFDSDIIISINHMLHYFHKRWCDSSIYIVGNQRQTFARRNGMRKMPYISLAFFDNFAHLILVTSAITLIYNISMSGINLSTELRWYSICEIMKYNVEMINIRSIKLCMYGELFARAT